MEYNRDLQALKQSFSGGGEGSFYIKCLKQLKHLPHIDWLDIGIGHDGSALQHFVDFCRSRNQSMAIVGVDPDVSSNLIGSNNVQWELIREQFQSWTSQKTFDVINADQSLYYMEDIEGELHRMMNMLNPGGLFIATCWSVDDDLHRLRQRLFPSAKSDLVGENLKKIITTYDDMELLDYSEFHTQVNFGLWRADTSLLGPAVRVISRLSEWKDMCSLESDLAVMLKNLPAVGRRINVAICARKA